VPGHGSVTNLATAKADSQAYLLALRAHMKKAVDEGTDVSAAVKSFNATPFHAAAERRRADARQCQPHLPRTRTRVVHSNPFKECTMEIKVLGTGCANCKTTVALIEQIAQAKGVPVTLSKVEELRDIMGYGVMSTPGVVIDGKVVHAGGVPSRDKIEKWL
jgi:small redox-active disulfide protein 2